MDERRLNADEGDIRKERCLSETEKIDRHVRQSARDRDVDEVQPRSRQPIHRFCGVMNPVEAPQDRRGVKGTVDPLLHQVGQNQNGDELRGEGLASNPRLHARMRRPAEQHHRRLHRQ